MLVKFIFHKRSPETFSFAFEFELRAPKKNMRAIIVALVLLVTSLSVMSDRIGNFNQVGMELMQKYYAAFDANLPKRSEVKDLYDAVDSYLVYAGESFIGVDKIMEKFNSVLNVVARNITSSDSQPTNDGGVIMNVFGRISSVDNTLLYFTEMFVIKPRVTSFFIQNQQFRSSKIVSNTSDVLHFV